MDRILKIFNFLLLQYQITNEISFLNVIWYKYAYDRLINTIWKNKFLIKMWKRTEKLITNDNNKKDHSSMED